LFITGTPVKFIEEQSSYLAVLINYSSQYNQSLICIFSPTGELVYKELLHKTYGILTIKPNYLKNEILLVGNGLGKVYSISKGRKNELNK
jgi:hypothetical protein